MTANEFNLKINLQAFCEANGKSDYKYVRMPRFGWFATDSKQTTVNSIFDFMPTDKILEFCMYLIQEKTQYHDSRIIYNELSTKRLANDIRIILTFKQFYLDCRNELLTGQAFSDGKYINVCKMYKDAGMSAFIDTGIGLITEAVASKYQVQLGLKQGVRNKLIVPTYCTPSHICSYEICDLSNINHRIPLYTNTEKGWYGKVNAPIVQSFNKLQTVTGCTWDYKLDYWTNQVVQLDKSLDVLQCLHIWKEARNTTFARSPLEVIRANNEVSKLKLNLQNLNMSQVEALQTFFKTDELLSIWKKQKLEQFKLGNVTFINKDNRYYIEPKNGNLEELTNFSVTVTNIFKRKKKFYRSGYINYGEKELAFEFENKAFESPKAFRRTINNFFFDNKLGIPLISVSYQNQVLEAVTRFNSNADFE